ncbi:efflux RND transporter periplasmic adaptor subunit [Geoalkalibacter subterraneus]|uniref:efflux RND transporter periplasmic adaptor subunit n=1 Tax=Geoalkalibacter subterraneus TaxID=483547 RepID=UPI00069331E0|nr:efflux RND transporter periplasmic adaptor subunit [Geoalkalibacter subterraneus]
MLRPKKIILVSALSLLFVASGATWYVLQCVTQMGWESFTGPAHVHAQQQWTCGMHPMIVTDEPGQCPICGMDLTPIKEDKGGSKARADGERKIKYWVAPMDPTYIRDEPGKSPMGMDLVPVYEDEAASGSIISVAPEVRQSMGVRTSLVERRDLHRTIRTVGLVDYDEPQRYSVNAKIDGWIERLYVDQTGQEVKKGQPLLELYSPKLVSAQEEYLLALRNRDALKDSSFSQISEGAERLLQSSRKRLQYFDISDRQIAELEKSGRVRKTMTLYSPYQGVVTMKIATDGQFIKSGTELFKISDLSSVWVMADIYAYELPWVEVGQQAEIILPYVGDKTRQAEISFIYPYVESKTRTIKARLEIANPDFELKPEMYVNVRIKGNVVEDALAIPSEAVINSGEKQTVFVDLGDGEFEPRQVKIGLQDDEGYVQITQGLLDGERVVTSAQFLFDSESRLREATKKLRRPAAEPEPEPEPEHDHNGDDMEDLFESDDEEDLESLFN